MSGWNVVSNCPSCGAPIYVPSVWGGITPPPPSFTCTCKTYQLQKYYEIDAAKNSQYIPAYINTLPENNRDSLEKKIELLEKEIEQLKLQIEEKSSDKQDKFLKKYKKILKG